MEHAKERKKQLFQQSNLSRMGRVMLSASNLASEGTNLNLSQNPSVICNSKRARNRLWTAASRARPFLNLCMTVKLSTSAITCARESRPGNTIHNSSNNSCWTYICIHRCRVQSIVGRIPPRLEMPVTLNNAHHPTLLRMRPTQTK